MPDTRQIIYWDANAFLSYVNELPDRMPILDALLESSADNSGSIKLYTSMLSEVEVAFAASEQQQQVLDPQIERHLDDLWNDPNAVVSVEYHATIGRLAKELMRNAITRGWSLKPIDAVHLATAQWLSNSGLVVDEFHTYDEGLVKYQALVNFKICKPYTEQPRMI